MEKGKETLLAKEDFNFEGQSTASGPIAELAKDGLIPFLGKFESSKATYTANLKTERFKLPRMFTMEQIRNMVFALMDQSTLNDRVSLNEKRYVKVHETGLRLGEMDENIVAR